MLALFACAISVHWVTAWNTYSSEQREHNQPIIFDEYINEALRQTFENIQSEILQLFLQVVLLAYLWYVGSPQSREGQDRLEEKLDWLGSQINPVAYQKLNEELDSKYPKK